MLLVPNLTRGEVCFLNRRALRHSQRQHARWRAVPLAVIKRSELDCRVAINPPGITHTELCVVSRRRSGMSTQQVADAMGVSRMWLFKLETGCADCRGLVKFWELTL